MVMSAQTNSTELTVHLSALMILNFPFEEQTIVDL